MKRSGEKRPRRGRPAAAALLCLAASCAATSEPTPAAGEPAAGDAASAELDRLAARLLEVAELRADLASARIWVEPFDSSGASRTPSWARAPSAPAEPDDEDLGQRLEEELVLALSQDVLLIDTATVRRAESALAPRAETAAEPERVDPRARFGATHLLLGDYQLLPREVEVTLRLVDARSMVILAVARGKLPRSALSATPRRERAPATAVPPASTPLTEAVEPAWSVEADPAWFVAAAEPRSKLPTRADLEASAQRQEAERLALAPREPLERARQAPPPPPAEERAPEEAAAPTPANGPAALRLRSIGDQRIDPASWQRRDGDGLEDGSSR